MIHPGWINRYFVNSSFLLEVTRDAMTLTTFGRSKFLGHLIENAEL